MGSLILGLFLGLVVSAIIGLIDWLVFECILYETCAEITCVIITVILCIVLTTAITIGICSYDSLQSTCYIERYNITKQTTEESINSDKLSGMERLQLVQSAIDENKYLKQQQFDCQQWYGFLIDKDVLKLEPINFE
jgi:uncharacterized protein YacL